MIKFIWKKEDFENIKHQLNNVSYEVRGDDVEFSIETTNEEEVKMFKLIDYLKSRISFQTPTGWTLISARAITFIESFGDDVYIHAEGFDTVHVRHTLYELETMLASYDVVRVGKSFLVNMLNIVTIEPILYAKLKLTLVDGSTIDVSRFYVKQFKHALGI